MTQSEIIDIAELRKRSLQLLQDVKEVLDNGGVKYWLDFGTLLGAVREGRSIIWDGDFDLSTLDTDIAERFELWDELRKRGYEIQIAYSNITITEKDWKVGWYKTDLHRYRLNNGGDVEYLYGVKYTSKIVRYILSLLDALSLNQTVNEIQKLKYYTPFDSICHQILNVANIPAEELESLGPITYQHGFLNSAQHFSLRHERFFVSKDPLKNAGSGFIFLSKIFNRCPPVCLQTIKMIFERMRERTNNTPLLKVRFPTDFFENLSAANFHDMTFNTPKPAEDYLTLVYGPNWRTPRVKWEFSVDAPQEDWRQELID